MAVLYALAITPRARDWLAATTRARILNVFDRACNLVNPAGEVLSLVASERGLTPFGLVLAEAGPAPFRHLAIDGPVAVSATTLTLGALGVDCSAARLWNPTPDWESLRACLAQSPGRLEALAVMVRQSAPPGSLLDLYGAPAHSPLSPVLVERARRGAVALVAGLEGGSTTACLEGARALAGLGGGLTPAGDDFVVGVCLAAWAGCYGRSAARLCAPLATAMAPSTTTLSGAYLRAAAAGDCAAPWHALFSGLRPGDVPATRRAVEALFAVGHTSGADALAGFIARSYLLRPAEDTMPP